MNILITGGAGFIGSQIGYAFWKSGASVVLLDNFSYGKEDNLIFPDKDFRSDVVRMDIRNNGIESLLRDRRIEAIIHCAGIAPLPDCQSNPREAIDVNVNGTVILLEAARKLGIRKFIFASTTAIYENDKEFPSHEAHFELPSLIYPNTKYAAERFCSSYCETYGMNVTALRFANVYGPHIDFLRKQPPFVAYMIRELYYDRVPTFYSNGTQSRDYVYIDDLIDLVFKIIGTDNQGFEAVNVSANRSYSVNEMFSVAARLMGKTITPHFEDPIQFWNKYPSLYEGPLPLKKEILVAEVNKKTLCDNALAKSRYGWEPRIDIEEGLKRLISYMNAILKKEKDDESIRS